jgi:hypothetical protein
LVLGDVMSKCLKWGNKTVKECVSWADNGANQCTDWRDDGYNSCTSWADQGSNQCSGWSKWFSWLCIVFYWVAKWVCVASVWITSLVCIAVVWIAALVCVASIFVVTLVCWIFADVLWPVVSTLTFGLIAPFAAGIDAVCESCNSYDWVLNFFLPQRIEFVSQEDNPSSPGGYIYTFICLCRYKKDKTVTVYAANDEEARIAAKKACTGEC